MTRPVAEEKWKLVKKAFVAILEKNATLLSFENLYSTVYQIVLNKHGDLVYDDLIELIRAYLQEVGCAMWCQGHNLQSRAMWNVRDCDGSSFLEMIQIRWKDHTVATAMIRDLTMYLKRVNHGRTGVYEAGLRAFHEEILLNEGILERLRSILLTMIEAERRGEATDR
ncbi:hypothetical protein L596_014078 [Steinernema carpocapsae]|uniref:Cullin N-terminal domain-containing protein n=1 Tax=Steinernema carpocapsae TaxID=34508 RepID=A0A4U5NAT8_STECR|nr:hypothetical protein L596_014078 [Steinernema carpocapsae]